MGNENNELALYEQVLLLGLRDDKGTKESRAGMLNLALGGSLLAELLLAEAVQVEGPKDKLVVSEVAPDDRLLLECLGKVRSAKRPKNASSWVMSFSKLPNLRQRIAEGLCHRGILKESEDKVLLLFTRRTFPTVDHGPERDLIDRLRSAILHGRSASEGDTILISIAKCTGLLRVHFDRKELKEHKVRLAEIAEGASLPEAGRATLAAVKAVQTAIIAATVAASAASSAAG